MLEDVLLKEREGKMIKKFNLNLPDELFNVIKIYAKKYGLSTTKFIIILLENGILNLIGGEKNEIKFDEIDSK